LESEWALGPDCPEEGLKAHALLKYLEDNEGVTVLDNDDRADVERIKTEIEELQTRYDNDDEVRTDLLDEIEELEEQLQEYENWIDVYNIVPTGEYYETTEFEVINSDLDEKRFAVGTEDEMQTSAYESIENLIDDIGYEGFNSSFARGYIDTDSVVSYAEDVYDEDVRNNPDVYFDNDERMLSEEQEESIGILKMRISQTQRVISNLEEQFGEDEDDDIQEKIEELEDLIVEYDDEIQEIEDSPDGDFPDDLVDEKINELVMDVRRDPESFMENFGLEWSEYVDKEEFIQGVIDTDGLAHVLNTYDGSADEIYVQQQLFYVMRID
jgi:predicted  nucleic acid-binding Zn-ribbon protein